MENEYEDYYTDLEYHDSYLSEEASINTRLKKEVDEFQGNR
jgi:hypothetical protein